MKRLYRFKSLCTEFQDKPPNHAGVSTEEEEEEEQMVKIKLTYFNIEGVAEKVWCLCVCVWERERELNRPSTLIPYPAVRTGAPCPENWRPGIRGCACQLSRLAR